MFKALFNEGYSKKFMDRIEFRRKEYYEKRRIQTIRANAMKMAMNWSHEYPTGTPLEYIRDDIIECWERTAGVGIYAGLIDKEATNSHMEAVQSDDPVLHGNMLVYPNTRGTRKDPAAQATIKKYKHEWRNPPDEGDPIYEAKLQREEDTLDNIAAYKIEGDHEK